MYNHIGPEVVVCLYVDITCMCKRLVCDTHIPRLEWLDSVPDDCVPDPTVLEEQLEELLKTPQVLTEFLT